MSNYSKSTNFTAKDALASGNPAKIIKGSEFDTEFDAIATAVATKLDITGSAATLTALPAAEGGSLALLYTLTPSAAATTEFTTGSHPLVFNGTYKKIVIEIISIKPSTDDDHLMLRIGTGAGPTYQTTSYEWGIVQQGVSTSADDGSTASGVTAGIRMHRTGSGQGVGSASGEKYQGTIVVNDLSGSDFIMFNHKGSYIRSDGVMQGVDGFGRYTGSVGPITAIRLLFASGNISSGTIKVYGVK